MSSKYRYDFLEELAEEQPKQERPSEGTKFWRRALNEGNDHDDGFGNSSIGQKKRSGATNAATKSSGQQTAGSGRSRNSTQRRSKTKPWRELCWLLWRPLFRFYTPNIHGDDSRNSKSEVDDQVPSFLVDMSNERAPIEEGKLLLLRIRRLALGTLVVALFFWVWAIINTREMKIGQDLGIYSFLTVILSSHVLLYKTQNEQVGITIPIRTFVTASHVLVTLNYILGFVYAVTVGTRIYPHFAIYCATFTLLWMAVSWIGWTLLLQLTILESRSGMESNDIGIAGIDSDYF